MTSNKSSGFTLIEMLVLVVIVGILVTVGISACNPGFRNQIIRHSLVNIYDQQGQIIHTYTATMVNEDGPRVSFWSEGHQFSTTQPHSVTW